MRHKNRQQNLHASRPADAGGPAAIAKPAVRSGGERTAADEGFVSAEDFDGTGILAGTDPCASSYWWMPDLHGLGAAPAVGGRTDAVTAADRPDVAAAIAHATQRTGSRTTAAA